MTLSNWFNFAVMPAVLVAVVLWCECFGSSSALHGQAPPQKDDLEVKAVANMGPVQVPIPKFANVDVTLFLRATPERRPGPDFKGKIDGKIVLFRIVKKELEATQFTWEKQKGDGSPPEKFQVNAADVAAVTVQRTGPAPGRETKETSG